MEKPKMVSATIPNPLPTPEEPLVDSFDHDKPVTLNTMQQTKEQEIFRVPTASNKETITYPLSPVIGRKRSHDESSTQESITNNTTNTNTHNTPPQDEDFVLVTEEPSVDDKISQSTAKVNLFPPRVPPGEPRVGMVERKYNFNQRQYFLSRLAEMRVHEDRQEVAAKKKVKERTTRRNRAVTPMVVANEELGPVTPPQDFIHDFKTPTRATRAHQAAPLKDSTAASDSLQTPPPTTKPRSVTPAHKVAAVHKPKKIQAEGPASKKVKTSSKAPRKEGSPESMGAEIKHTLNKRFEAEGMNGVAGKGAYKLFEDAYIPQIDFDSLPDAPDRDKVAAPKPFNQDDPAYHLIHPKEHKIARQIGATPSEYLTQKRRLFLGLAEWYRLGRVEFKKAHAQMFCNQDGNSSSHMADTYSLWGWTDIANYPDELLDRITPLLPARGRLSWPEKKR